VSTAIAVPAQGIAVRHELDVVDVIAQVKKIQLVMSEVMIKSDPDKGIEGHYGVIPGTNKPTLLQAGADKLLLTFRLDPEFEPERVWDGKHLTVYSKCVLWHIPSGLRYGSGTGSCSTKESRYAYRKGARTCPNCGSEAIIKGKEQYGGGWLCWDKRGGCGSKWKDGDAAIESQTTDRVPNEDLADQYNTVEKMANKRAKIAAVLNVTAASDIFTQDMEDAPPSPPIAPSASGDSGQTPKPTEAELVTESENLFPTPNAIRDPLIKRIEKFSEAKVVLLRHRLDLGDTGDWRKMDVAALDMLANHLEGK
jgi:hypothetical protein